MTENVLLCYKKLMDKAKDLSIFQSAESIVHWDMETMMPPKAIKLRSQQLAMLSRIEHKMSTDPEIRKLLEEIMRHPDYDDIDAVQKRNVYLIRKIMMSKLSCQKNSWQKSQNSER